MECIGHKPEWMLGCIKLWFIGLGNHNIKQIRPGVTTVQRILIKKKKTLKSKLKEIMT